MRNVCIVIVALALMGGGMVLWDSHHNRVEDAALAALPPSLVTEIDGCRIYRFYDQGHWRNFAKCPFGATVEGEDCVVDPVTKNEVCDLWSTESDAE